MEVGGLWDQVTRSLLTVARLLIHAYPAKPIRFRGRGSQTIGTQEKHTFSQFANLNSHRAVMWVAGLPVPKTQLVRGRQCRHAALQTRWGVLHAALQTIWQTLHAALQTRWQTTSGHWSGATTRERIDLLKARAILAGTMNINIDMRIHDSDHKYSTLLLSISCTYHELKEPHRQILLLRFSRRPCHCPVCGWMDGFTIGYWCCL